MGKPFHNPDLTGSQRPANELGKVNLSSAKHFQRARYSKYTTQALSVERPSTYIHWIASNGVDQSPAGGTLIQLKTNSDVTS